MLGILIPVEGDVRVVEHDGTWQSIAKVIGSQYVERVHLGLPDGQMVFVDEEGLVINKPVNPRLTLLYPGISQGIFLHGDGLVVQEAMGPEGLDVVDMPEAHRFAVVYGRRLGAELDKQPGFRQAVAAHNAGL